MTWIPITEALPLPGVWVKVLGDFGRDEICMRRNYTRRRGMAVTWRSNTWGERFGVTHWWMEGER